MTGGTLSARGLAAVLALTAGLGACDHPRIPDAVHPDFTDPARRHPIVVAPQTESVDIAVGRGGAAYDQAYIETIRFMRQYKRSTGGPLYVSLPGGSGSAAGLVRTAAQREGIPSERIRWQHASGRGAMTLSYDRIAAIPPQCGDWSEDVTRNPERVPYANWGCASQHNLAAMAANPTDTIFPAREVPRIGPDRPGAPKQSAATAAAGANGGQGAGASPSPAAPPPAAGGGGAGGAGN